MDRTTNAMRWWGTVGRAAALACVVLGLAACETFGSKEPSPQAKAPAKIAPSEELAHAIRYLGGEVRSPSDFAATQSGFQEYLGASGVWYFSSGDMTTPHDKDKAAAAGFRYFLPRKEWWPRGVALALVGQRLYRVIGGPIKMRNWWRPPAYNRAVGGDPDGDHPTAHGVDLDYVTPEARERAEAYLRTMFYDEPWLELSLGFGMYTTHVGMFSPRGCRAWYYRSHPQHDGETLRAMDAKMDCRKPPAADAS